MSGQTTRSRGGHDQPWDSWLTLIWAWQHLMVLATAKLAPDWLYQPIDAAVIGGGNFSLLSTTITQQRTDQPGLEHAIISDVASYGRQLGRILEALTVLVDQVHRPLPDASQEAALTRLTDMADQIRQAQSTYADRHLDTILDDIRLLGGSPADHDAFQRIRTLVDEMDAAAAPP
jgi:hypothetical protein